MQGSQNDPDIPNWILLEDMKTYRCTREITEPSKIYHPGVGTTDISTLRFPYVEITSGIYDNETVIVFPYGDDKGLEILAQTAVRLGAVLSS